MKKTFDCVEMKREGAERLRERLSKMTRDEQVAFWRERTEALRRRAEKLREQRRRSQPTPHET